LGRQSECIMDAPICVASGGGDKHGDDTAPKLERQRK
jgi:hypothetical protein